MSTFYPDADFPYFEDGFEKSSAVIDKVETKRKDQELYEQWKKTGSKEALGLLINQLSGPIYSEVQRQAGTLPNTALSAEAKKWAIRAIKTYDPTRGASISTHVMGYLPKVRRMNYKFQNAARLPENMQLKYKLWDRAVQNLADKLNRDPTDEEIATELGWSKGLVVKFRNSLYEDLIESSTARPYETSAFNENKILLDHIMSELSVEEKTIWENSKQMSSEDLAQKLGININRLNYLKAKLKNKVQKIKNDIGLY
jgi:DNA-directed RNA polymerase specialized sigma subunit